MRPHMVLRSWGSFQWKTQWKNPLSLLLLTPMLDMSAARLLIISGYPTAFTALAQACSSIAGPGIYPFKGALKAVYSPLGAP